MSNDGQNNDELNQNTQTALPNEGASINRRSLLKGVMGAAGVASLPSFVFPALAQGERSYETAPGMGCSPSHAKSAGAVLVPTSGLGPRPRSKCDPTPWPCRRVAGACWP